MLHCQRGPFQVGQKFAQIVESSFVFLRWGIIRARGLLAFIAEKNTVERFIRDTHTPPLPTCPKSTADGNEGADQGKRCSFKHVWRAEKMSGPVLLSAINLGIYIWHKTIDPLFDLVENNIARSGKQLQTAWDS